MKPVIKYEASHGHCASGIEMSQAANDPTPCPVWPSTGRARGRSCRGWSPCCRPPPAPPLAPRSAGGSRRGGARSHSQCLHRPWRVIKYFLISLMIQLMNYQWEAHRDNRKLISLDCVTLLYLSLLFLFFHVTFSRWLSFARDMTYSVSSLNDSILATTWNLVMYCQIVWTIFKGKEGIM